MTTLRRELGRWDLTAIGINQVIGSGIFLLPAAVAAEVGARVEVARRVDPVAHPVAESGVVHLVVRRAAHHLGQVEHLGDVVDGDQ